MKRKFESLDYSNNEKQKRIINSLYEALEEEGLFQDLDAEEKSDTQEKYFKNTKLLLKNYRALIFALSYSSSEVADELNCKSFEELESVIAHYRDFSAFGNKIPESIAARLDADMRAIKLINRLRKALTVLKNKPFCYNSTIKGKISGLIEFNSIYYSYIEMSSSLYSVSELIKQSNDIQTENISIPKNDISEGSRSDEDIAILLGVSDREFKAIRTAAIEDLSAILWGGYTKEISYIIDFLENFEL